MSTPHVIVIDLDGTLCNSAHREHLAAAKQWDDFHSLLGADEPWPDVKQMIELLSGVGNYYLVGLTGRNERYRQITHQWLMNHDIFLDNLLMRPDNDFTSDAELKPRLLAESGVLPSEVWFILEDRDKVVEAWRNLGYNCWQCRPGGY
jgi:hypothetical protein